MSQNNKKDIDDIDTGYWGWDFTGYGDYGHDSYMPQEETKKPQGRGCICGQDSVDRIEDKLPIFHSTWCPVYKKD